jgi:hypothetical protein
VHLQECLLFYLIKAGGFREPGTSAATITAALQPVVPPSLLAAGITEGPECDAAHSMIKYVSHKLEQYRGPAHPWVATVIEGYVSFLGASLASTIAAALEGDQTAAGVSVERVAGLLAALTELHTGAENVTASLVAPVIAALPSHKEHTTPGGLVATNLMTALLKGFPSLSMQQEEPTVNLDALLT